MTTLGCYKPKCVATKVWDVLYWVYMTIFKLSNRHNFKHTSINESTHSPKNRNKSDFSTKKGKTTLIPGYFDGEYFEASQKRSAGMVCVLSSCNSMIMIDSEVERLKKDSLIKILPINWKFFSDIKKDFLTHE